MRWVLFVILIVKVNNSKDETVLDEASARKLFKILDKKASYWSNLVSNAEWDYETNLTTYNLQKKLRLNEKYTMWQKEMWENMSKYPWENFEDTELKRQFKKFSFLGTATLPDNKRNRLDETVAEMQKIYSTSKVKPWRRLRSPKGKLIGAKEKKNIQLDPDLVSIFASEPNESCKLRYYWQGWHDTVGRKVKSLFEEYVGLANEAAKLNNFSDNAAMWIDDFEMDDFEKKVHKLYLQIRRPYQQLHAYVRRKLRKKFNTGEETVIKDNGLLPAHILGNVWAQQWDSIYQMTVPFPGKGSVDITPVLKAQKYNTTEMVKLAEDFFTSLNLSAMTDMFWEKSIFEKLQDRDMICHASAWDFYDGEDFRIKMCTKVNLDDLKTIHHEMGHIQYFQQYKDLPFAFRSGANSGFHEAVGDTLALSVSTAKHLMKIGLIDPDTYVDDKETEINFLYFMALEKLVFLPYAYVLDLWRWEVFRGEIPPSQYNCRFWKLRQELQGITPPVDRSDADLDAGGKYHVVADVPYIRYFVSHVIQFQFHKALCAEAGEYDPGNPQVKPLHKCDIYRSAAAGNVLREMLKMGSSRHWQDALETVTHTREMDAGPLIEYFRPLLAWLEEENLRNNENIGWKNTGTVQLCQKDTNKNYNSKKQPKYNGCDYVISEEETNNTDSKDNKRVKY